MPECGVGVRVDVEIRRVVLRVLGAHIVDLSGDWWRVVEGVEFCWSFCGCCWGLLIDAASLSSSSSSSDRLVAAGGGLVRSVVGGVSGSMKVVWSDRSHRTTSGGEDGPWRGRA